MRTKIISMLTGLIMAVFMVTATASDSVNLSSSLRIISSSDNGAGLSTITLEIVLNNDSETDLTNIKLELLEDSLNIDPNSSALLIDSINSGTSVTVNWTVNSNLPAELWSTDMPMQMLGSATNSNGDMLLINTMINI